MTFRADEKSPGFLSNLLDFFSQISRIGVLEVGNSVLKYWIKPLSSNNMHFLDFSINNTNASIYY